MCVRARVCVCVCVRCTYDYIDILHASLACKRGNNEISLWLHFPRIRANSCILMQSFRWRKTCGYVATKFMLRFWHLLKAR